MAIKAHGTLIKIGNGATPETFSTIAEVNSIGGPGLSADTADVTTHDSTDGWEEVIPTILRSGEVSLELKFDPAGTTHTKLTTDMDARTKRNFELVFPNVGVTTWSFAGYITAFEPSAAVDAELTASCTIKLTGKPTLS